MDDSRLQSIAQLTDLLKGTEKLDLSLRLATIADRYAFINRLIKKFNYSHLGRKDKKIIRRYLKKITGYRHSQLNRLIARSLSGSLKRLPYHRLHPSSLYTTRDIKLLEETDELHQRLNGLATKEILRRETEIFGVGKYQNIAKVSLSHLYNLRHSDSYKNTWVNHTKPRIIPIGITKPPDNFGLPGSVRVDTVHQREIYHLNAVDEITQWEVVVAVPAICEEFLKPALEIILSQFPFTIFNFHSDRGSEFINALVAELLTKLHINQTKSRSTHPNDNALVETKNGSVIRKNMGWEHLDRGACDLINHYYRNFFNPYLNYHRPCLFVTNTKIDDKGRRKKHYGQASVPYEKLKTLVLSRPDKQILKPETTLSQLDQIAYQYSDNQFARILREEERKLFTKINNLNHKNGSRR